MTTTDAPTYTEADLTAMLRQKLTRPGNGGSGEYAFMAQVRNAAGFDAKRTFDAVSVALWPSRGFVIHVYEIKVSRSDWLTELRKPEKAEDAALFGDKFSMVVPPGIIKDGELPPAWGQLTVRGDKLITTKEASYLHELPVGGVKKLPPVPRSQLVPMLRAAGGAAVTPKELKDAYRRGHTEGSAGWKENYERECEKHEATRALIREFTTATGGVTLQSLAQRRDAAQVGAAVRAVLAGEARITGLQHRLRTVQDELRRAADSLDQYLPDDEAVAS